MSFLQRRRAKRDRSMVRVFGKDLSNRHDLPSSIQNSGTPSHKEIIQYNATSTTEEDQVISHDESPNQLQVYAHKRRCKREPRFLKKSTGIAGTAGVSRELTLSNVASGLDSVYGGSIYSGQDEGAASDAISLYFMSASTIGGTTGAVLPSAGYRDTGNERLFTVLAGSTSNTSDEVEHDRDTISGGNIKVSAISSVTGYGREIQISGGTREVIASSRGQAIELTASKSLDVASALMTSITEK